MHAPVSFLFLFAISAFGIGCTPQRHALASSPSTDFRANASPRCFRVFIGSWSNTGQSMGLTPPTEFRLDTALSARQLATQGERKVYPPFASARISRFPAEWREFAADSVRISWGTGFQSGGYRLRVHGDSVDGIATTWTDARTGKPDPEARVIGARVPCLPTTDQSRFNFRPASNGQ